ncbi:serine/threonine-protein kinase [Actinomadura sp. J1-007]|uniref:serine/threonine-protein kinase n=1 Tax=Actinomadura sp. J1-007 TaxID=2661913 RepID=UPI001F4F78F4|nr:serine/threonine-protein kinase [Actinomadura sp. J1-007]
MTERVVGGRYRLVERIGRGGMGTVWTAVDETLRRDVAVKEVLLPEGLSAEERRVAGERARREARAAALIDHPGVVTVHDVVVEDGRPWIVMELIEGRSLGALIRENGPSHPKWVATVGLRLLDALEAAHARGVLHRDVKPGNVLLADGLVYLTDFGIASIEADTSLTRTGALVGSPGYMAPERLREEPAGPGSDLWSLGATLYTAAEGAPRSSGPGRWRPSGPSSPRTRPRRATPGRSRRCCGGCWPRTRPNGSRPRPSGASWRT